MNNEAFASDTIVIEDYSGRVEDYSDRRINTRKVFCVRAEVTLPSGVVLHSHTVDLSEGGMGLVTSDNLQKGETCTIEFTLAACGMETKIKIVGEICYSVHVATNQYRIGLRFVNTDESTINLIRSIVR